MVVPDHRTHKKQDRNKDVYKMVFKTSIYKISKLFCLCVEDRLKLQLHFKLHISFQVCGRQATDSCILNHFTSCVWVCSWVRVWVRRKERERNLRM